MNSSTIGVPLALLCTPNLPASAKLIWMVARQHSLSEPLNLPMVQNATGLCRPTVRNGLTKLAASQWRLDAPAPAAPAPDAQPVPTDLVPVPCHLLQDQHLGILAKVLYGVLRGMPGGAEHRGSFTYVALSSLIGLSINPVKRAIGDLAATGWLQVTQENRRAPIRFVLADPRAARCETALFEARQRLEEAPFRGEALMREYLSLLVADSIRFQDDARPGFLTNPLTGAPLELDRYYDTAKVGFEYNGPQHHGATEKFTARQAAAQRVRDLIKYGLCWTENVHLVLVEAEDLTLETMKQKVGSLLPLRDLQGYEALITLLEASSRRHREEIERMTARQKKRGVRR